MKMLTIFLSLAVYVISCDGAETVNYGMKQYTIVLDTKQSINSARETCRSQYKSNLVDVLDTETLRFLSVELYKLREDISDNIHDLWIGGKSNQNSNNYLDLIKTQPKENGARCLVLSNRTTQRSGFKYNVYTQTCNSRSLHFICEKNRDLVTSSPIFGSIPTYDRKLKRFNYHNQKSIISAVHVYEYNDGTYQYISCISFTNGGSELPCHGKHASKERKWSLGLQQDEYITEVTGDKVWFVTQIKFVTNKNNVLGPVGVSSGLGGFKVNNGDAPLLYVSGTSGMWLYQIQFHFLSYKVDELTDLTNFIAANVHNAIKSADLEQLIDINSQYKHMLFDLATRGCNIFTYQEEGNYADYEVCCSLKFLLEQLNSYASSTNALKKHQPRNLMKISEYNSEVLLDEVTEAKNFHKLLTELSFKIESVGSELQETVIDVNRQSAENLARYFTTVAEFDQRVAEDDKDGIVHTIQSLSSASSELMRKLNIRIRIMLGYAIAITGADLVEAGVRLGAAIAKNSNPLGWLTGAADPNDVFEHVAAVATATKNLAHATKLMATLHTYTQYMKKLKYKFGHNQRQLQAIQTIIEKFPTAQDDEIEKLADDFLDADFEAQVSKHEIVYAVELLSQVISEGCDLISNSESVIADIAGTVAHVVEGAYAIIANEPGTVCTQLQPLLAQLRQMYESVYDFQFELVDALTRIVRANIAKNMAEKIADIKASQTITVQTAAIASMMMEIRYQAVAHARCQELEYKNGGNRPDDCKHIHFTDNLITNIISYNVPVETSERKGFAFIPTAPLSTNIRAPFLDIEELLSTHVTHFQVPLNDKAWMVKYKWLPDTYFHDNYDRETSYLINRLEIFIPGLKCKGSVDYTVSIDVESGTSVNLFSEVAPPSYIIPSTKFRVTYDRTHTCAGQLVDYDIREDNQTLSSRGKQSVCVTSEGTSDNLLLPSLYSTWTVKLLLPQDCEAIIDSSLNFVPLVTVKYKMDEVLATGMNECWPDTRCAIDQRCVDGMLSYQCQNND